MMCFCFKRSLSLTLALTVTAVLPGCVGPRSAVEVLYENGFKEYRARTVGEIKRWTGTVRMLPYAPYHHVWDSLLIVAMQQGVIVQSQRDDNQGILVVMAPQP